MAQPKEKWHGRGTATIYEDDSIEFRPCGKGEPSQRNVKRSGASKFYQTNGEKESNYVAHLMAPMNALDPVGDMLKDFETLTRELEPQLPREPRTKPLMKRDGLAVYLDKKLSISTRRSIKYASSRKLPSITNIPTALPTGHTL